MPGGEGRRLRKVRKGNHGRREGVLQIKPEVVADASEKGRRGVEGDSGNAELVGEVMGPAEEEIRDYGDRRRRMGVEPLEDGVVKLGESVDEGKVAMVADVLEVLNPRREGWVVRKIEDKGFERSGMGGEEGIEKGQVLGSDEQGEEEVGVGEK